MRVYIWSLKSHEKWHFDRKIIALLKKYNLHSTHMKAVEIYSM